MSNPLGRLLNNLFGFGKAWWIEIKTESPNCTYFFGPFNEEAEAQTAQAGYIEDLEQEGAQRIRIDIRRCARPEELTIDNSEDYRGGFSPAFSGQS
ncbi:MAG: DUF1816 domain-containing protein [Cyanobacteria bacterium Co-bin13]|nr:DUF1816 domain-containing protein [Cyanobacteria bacterium Co-bin13]